MVFANRFGKIEEQLKQLDLHKTELTELDIRVTKFEIEVGKITTTLDNLSKEVTNLRSENQIMIREFREEQRLSMKDFKDDNRNSLKDLGKSMDRLADKIDSKG